TQNSSESSSMSVGTGYGTGGAGATGSAAFSQGEGSSEEVHHKNSHIIDSHHESGKYYTGRRRGFWRACRNGSRG
ncbi:pantoate kinase, partial [Bartonella silvatica]